MIKVILNNNKSRLTGDLKVVMELRKLSRLRVPGAFYSPNYGKNWDGFKYYISDITGLFPTGMFEWIVTQLRRLKIEYEVIDQRPIFKDMHEPTTLGGKDFRDYQLDSVSSLLNNRVYGVRFVRGLLNETTNAGKNLISAGIFKSFSSKRKGIFLIDNTEIFSQALLELEELMPGEVGCVYTKKTDIKKRVTICMVQTLASRLKKDVSLRAWLGSMDIVIVDEVDTTGNRKDCMTILGYCPEASIRVGVSGTSLKSRDKTRNQNLINFFGPIIHTTTNREMVAKGYSTPPDIRIYAGNMEFAPTKNDRVPWADQYREAIVTNRRRHKRIWKVVSRLRKKTPILILYKLHEHGRRLMKAMPLELRDTHRVAMIDGTSGERTRVLRDFKAGKIDILVCSMIIRRGKNLPLTKVLINAAGGESEANVLQLLGRVLRKHESKKKVYMIDFWDRGVNLQKHSRRRLIAYKNEKFPVKQLYKKKLADYSK